MNSRTRTPQLHRSYGSFHRFLNVISIRERTLTIGGRAGIISQAKAQKF